jgi:long-chain acyl-CoA synthetase
MVYLAKEGSDINPAKLREYLSAKLAPFKVPAYFWQVHEPLPRLGTQKIDRVSLRREYNDMAKAA